LNFELFGFSVLGMRVGVTVRVRATIIRVHQTTWGWRGKFDARLMIFKLLEYSLDEISRRRNAFVQKFIDKMPRKILSTKCFSTKMSFDERYNNSGLAHVLLSFFFPCFFRASFFVLLLHENPSFPSFSVICVNDKYTHFLEVLKISKRIHSETIEFCKIYVNYLFTNLQVSKSFHVILSSIFLVCSKLIYCYSWSCVLKTANFATPF